MGVAGDDLQLTLGRGGVVSTVWHGALGLCESLPGARVVGLSVPSGRIDGGVCFLPVQYQRSAP